MQLTSQNGTTEDVFYVVETRRLWEGDTAGEACCQSAKCQQVGKVPMLWHLEDAYCLPGTMPIANQTQFLHPELQGGSLHA